MNTKTPKPQDEKPIVQVNNGNNARASWPISLNNLRVNIAHMRPEAKRALVDCFLWCIRNDITKAEFASAIGSSDNTVYKWITGRYTHPNTGERMDVSAKHLDSMERWLKEQKALTELRTEFIVTPTSEKVFLACHLAQESRTPVFLFGPSHIGKTWALERFTERNNHGRTVYVRLGAASGLGGMLREIAKAIGVSYQASKERMIQTICSALVSDMLLILDEVHELLHTYRKESFFACIEVLREFHDRVGCGMVLCVTKVKWDEIKQHRVRDLEQIFKRGVHRIALGTKSGQPLQKDVKLILAYYGLEFPKRKDQVIVDNIQEQPYEILRQLSKTEGLKSITERIRYANKFAGRKGSENCSWDDFVRAHLTIKANATEAEDWA